jgi:CDP-ribitol ribitolphosphotransferase
MSAEFPCQLVALRWERLNLIFSFQGEFSGTPCLANSHRNQFIRLARKAATDTSDTLSGLEADINLTVALRDGFPENGYWDIGFLSDGHDLANGSFTPCSLSNELACQLLSLTRIFRYDGLNMAYTASFEVRQLSGNALGLCLSSVFMKIDQHWSRHVLHTDVFSVFKSFFARCANMFLPVLYTFLRCLCRLLRLPNHTVLFLSGSKDAQTGNLAALYKRFCERGLNKQYVSLVFARKLLYHRQMLSWLTLVWYLARSGVVFLDDYIPLLGLVRPDKLTQIVQLWHAGGGYKAVGYARFGKVGSPLPTASAHRRYTMAVAPSKYWQSVYAEMFGLTEDKILVAGLPRLDGFLEPNYRLAALEKVYARIPSIKDKKTILYAPTFRGVGQRDAFFDMAHLDFKKIYDFCKEDTVFLIKLHPFVDAPVIPERFNRRIMDVTNLADINELFFVSDILVTDYSSCYYEYALLKKPIVFYAYDLIPYELIRGLCLPIVSTAPGKICLNFNELMQALEKSDYDFEKTLAFAEQLLRGYQSSASDTILKAVLHI